MNISAIMNWLKALTHEGRIARRKEKLEKLFQVDNRLVNRNNGAIFTVYEVSAGQAMLLDEDGNPLMASWYTNAGRLKAEMAETWDIAPV